MKPKMAEEAGVSADTLRERIEKELQATYVEIEDMSGLCPSMPLYYVFFFNFPIASLCTFCEQFFLRLKTNT